MARKSQKKFAQLRGRIVELYGSQECFALALGLSNTSVSKKLNGVTSFSSADIVCWAEKLDITVDDIGQYFFNDFLAVG